MKIESKGISPLVAVVLLIAFTITVATFIAAFSQSFVRERTEEFEQQTEELSGECQRANLQIQSAEYSSGDNQLSTLIFNRGETNLTDFRIRAFTSDVDFTEHTPSNADVNLESGDIVTLRTGNVTQRPEKIEAVSQTCPAEAIAECQFSGGQFIC